MAGNRRRISPASSVRYYQSGNTVRLEDYYVDYLDSYAEDYVEEIQEETEWEQSRQRQVREEKRRRNHRKVRKNQEKAMHMSLPYVMMLSVATVLSVFVCYHSLRLQSEISASKRSVQELQVSVSKLKAANNAAEDSLKIYTDLDYIYKVATKKLGMTYPSEDQVIRFDRTESEYVRQYEDIPTSD